MIRFERRPEPSRAWSLITPVLAVIATMFTGGILFWFLGENPFTALKAIFWEPLFGEFAFFYRPQLLIKGAPLVLIAIGLALGFRAGIWNIGAEGQYIMGAIFGAAVALAFFPATPDPDNPTTLGIIFDSNPPRWVLFPLMILGGAIGGFLWAMIPALLRVRFGTNEILVSLMLVYVAQSLLAAMALGLLRNPEGMGFPGSRNLGQWAEAANKEIIAGSGMHWGVVAALIAVIFAYILLTRHVAGFHIRLTGESPRAARFAGVRPGRLVILCLGLSGALAGLAGLFEVAGPAGQISIDFNVGYGFTAIIVAFLGRLHPIGILLAGGLMALTYIGGEIAQSNLGLPIAAVQIFQGMLLFFLLAMDLFTHFRLRIGTGATA